MMEHACPVVVVEGTLGDKPPQSALRRSAPVVGVNGLRQSQYEIVLAKLLPFVQPQYSTLPAWMPASELERITRCCAVTQDDDDDSKTEETLWPFHALPDAARVYGDLEGQLKQYDRGLRKEQQLQSMIRCILALLPSNFAVLGTEDQLLPFTIVDFGGGSGHLGIPLALILPQCRVIVVDLNERRLKLLHGKARHCILAADEDIKKALADSSPLSCRSLQPTAISNLFTFYGPIEKFDEPFNMGLALHLCGEATDVALRRCGSTERCQSLVFAPCCVGKLNLDTKNPLVYQATGSQARTVSYPQSALFCQYVDSNDWNVLAKAADYGDMTEFRTARNASRRTAKALVETDRLAFLEQEFGFTTSLTRMDPWEATPKNDIIVAWRGEVNGYRRHADPACDADVLATVGHIFHSLEVPIASNESVISAANVNWSQEEEQDVRQRIANFLETQDSCLVFPIKMGGRRRKLIHFVAEQMGLRHWPVGKKYAEKTVCVARKKGAD
jgi:hypothetical protein